MAVRLRLALGWFVAPPRAPSAAGRRGQLALVQPRLGNVRRERPYREPRAQPGVIRDGPGANGALGSGGWPDATGAAPALARARDLADRGRYAAAERVLKRTAGLLARRRRCADEARVHLAIGCLRAARGRGQLARDAFETSRRLFDAAGDGDGSVRALLHVGSVLIDDDDLAGAESVLRSAAGAARPHDPRGLARAAGLLLAKCLYWQGRPAEAVDAAERARVDDGPSRAAASSVAERMDDAGGVREWGAADGPPADLLPGLSVIATEIAVRHALDDRDVARAARALAAAGDPQGRREPREAAALCALAVLVHGARGDLASAHREFRAGVASFRGRCARAASLELRLAHLEALMYAGNRAEVSACLRRLGPRRTAAVTGLARARLERVTAWLRRTPSHPVAQAAQVDCAVLVRILRQYHDADDDRAAVAGVCRCMRATLDAASVSALQLTGATRAVAINDGGRPCGADVAGRAAAARLALGPVATAGGWEAAAPVHHGDRVVGALAARWARDQAPGDAGRVLGLLSAAAAAIAPALASVGEQAERAAGAGAAPGELTGASAAIAALRARIARAAAAPFPILIQGESGTGKELIAKAIHAGSPRRQRRFCAINCAALSDDLFETELFGHARGAFTGAASDRQGLFEEADGGTLFLDEVGELSPRAQAKLLRAIQEGEVRRVGENHPRRVDARIVSATNRPLADDARAGRFRTDLLFRLDVVRIVVPPLRERREDIVPLARLFWREATARLGGRAELTRAALDALARYDWPGNVRELQNTLAALAVQAPSRGRIGSAALPHAIAGATPRPTAGAVSLAAARRTFEETYVRTALVRSGGHRAEAAAALGLTRQGLAKLMERLGIEAGAWSEAAY